MGFKAISGPLNLRRGLSFSDGIFRNPESIWRNKTDQLNRVREPLPALMGLQQTKVYSTIRGWAMLETLYAAALRVS